MERLTPVGLLGGMSWRSSAIYYSELNELVAAARGGHASAPVVLWSVEFGEIEALQRAGDWAAQGRILADAAQRLEATGVGAIALATNTLHLVADAITARISVPFIDLIDVTATAASALNVEAVGLLATDYTMTSDLYPARLAQHGVHTLVPGDDDRAVVQRVIYDELVRGIVTESSRAALVGVIDRLSARGAQAIVLGCTELALSVRPGDVSLPLLDTTTLHCRALADVILAAAPVLSSSGS